MNHRSNRAWKAACLSLYACLVCGVHLSPAVVAADRPGGQSVGASTPRGRAVDCLVKMEGGQRVEALKDGEKKLDYGAVAAWRDKRLYVLVYSHNAKPNQPYENDIQLTIRGKRIIGTRAWSVSEQLFDRDNGIYVHEMYKDIEAAGISPAEGEFYLSPIVFKYKDNIAAAREVVNKNSQKYQKLSEMKQVRSGERVAVKDDALTFKLQMNGSGFRFLELIPMADDNE